MFFIVLNLVAPSTFLLQLLYHWQKKSWFRTLYGEIFCRLADSGDFSFLTLRLNLLRLIHHRVVISLIDCLLDLNVTFCIHLF